MHKWFILIHLFHSSTRFEHCCARLQEDNCIDLASGTVTLFGWRYQMLRNCTTVETQQAVWKGRLWGKSVLEENIRTVVLTTGGSQRLFCVWIFIQSSERQASGTVLWLPARQLYWCRLHFWSECTASSLRTTNACQILHAHFNSLFHSAHHKNTEWDLHQNEKCHYMKI